MKNESGTAVRLIASCAIGAGGFCFLKNDLDCIRNTNIKEENMGIEYVEKLSTPEEIKQKYPVSKEMRELKNKRDEEIKKILTGESDKFLLIISCLIEFSIT